MCDIQIWVWELAIEPIKGENSREGKGKLNAET